MFYLKIKRIIDILLSIIGLVVLAPLFLIIAIAIKVDSKGQILFKQKRIGKDKKIFDILKFRTMQISAPKDSPTHMLENPEIYITRVGKILRKTSLDELPQIWNILNGNMSIIGPRPALWNQYDLINERDKYGANNIRPGLTGLAQINGRDELSIKEKAKLDGEYANQINLFRDANIFLMTIYSILVGRGVIEGAAVRAENEQVSIKIPNIKKVLVVTTVASTIDQFCMNDIKIYKESYEVDIAANFNRGNNTTEKRLLEFREILTERGISINDINFDRNPLSRNNFFAFREIKNLFEVNFFDIVHCHTPIAAAIVRIAAIKTRKKGTKVIYTAHGFHFYSGAKLWSWLLYYPIEKCLSYFTDIIITINTEDYIRAKKSFKAQRIVYIPGIGIDTQNFSSSKENKISVREELGLPKKAFILLSVGELNKNKNHEVIIKSISKIRNKNIYYIICGKGPREEYLKKLAHTNGIDSQVLVLGFRSDIAKIYNAADVFVLPSIREGLSVALMEAMAAGLPVIASRIRGNVDLIVESKGGYLIKPSKVDQFTYAINLLLNNNQIVKQMGELNKEVIKSYDSKNIEKLLRKIYLEDLD